MQKLLVPPMGPKTARIVLIGEAPGAQEEIQGIPFCGYSGKLLHQTLRNVGVNISDVYITNVVKERPPGNKIEHFIVFKNDQIATMTKEYLEYEAQLKEELKELNPSVVIPLGRTALWATYRHSSISKWRGSILDGRSDFFAKPTKLVPSIHPANVLREWLEFYNLEHDLKRAFHISLAPTFQWRPERTILIEPSFEDALLFLDSAKECKEIGFDIEVINEEMSCFAVAKSAFNVMSIPLRKGIPFRKGINNYFSAEEETLIMSKLAELLQEKSIKKIGQNIIFDASFLFRKYGIVVVNIEDTMIAQGIVTPDTPKGLDYITSIYTYEPYYKDDGKKWLTKALGDETAFWRYNAKDAAVCMEAFPKLETDLAKQSNLEAYEKQRELFYPCMFMQEHGMFIDSERMKQISEGIGKQLEEKSKRLNQVVGYKINPNSPPQLKKHFYILKGEKPYIKRGTGSETTDEKALKRLARKGYEEASIILEMRGLAKVKNTYMDMTLDPDNRMRGAFNPIGTIESRLSSSKTIFGTGGNMQNLPPEMQDLIYADPGYVFYYLDLEQADNRTVAYIAPDANMIYAFEHGIDIHKQTASLIFGIPYDQVSDEEGSCPEIGDGSYSQRFWGKKANHGLNYDLGADTFSLYYEIPLRDAEFIVAKYHQAYPGIRGSYHKWIQEDLKQDRTLVNPFGMSMLFLDRWCDKLFKQGYAWIPASTTAGITNRRGLSFVYEHPEMCRKVQLLNCVHDAVWLQISLKESIEDHLRWIGLIKESLEQPLTYRGRTWSIPVGIKMGLGLGSLKKVKKPEDQATILKELKEAQDAKKS